MVKRISIGVLLLTAGCFGDVFTSTSGPSLGGDNVVITPDPSWYVMPGVDYISKQNTGWGGIVIPNSDTIPWAVFYQPFVSGAGQFDLTTMGDDVLVVKLDGTTLLPWALYPDFFAAINLSTQIAAGPHMLEEDLFQTAGSETGIAYSASFPTPIDSRIITATPEPSSWFMAIGCILIMFGSWARTRAKQLV